MFVGFAKQARSLLFKNKYYVGRSKGGKQSLYGIFTSI